MTRVALLVSDFEDGGVERNFTRIASGLAGLGAEVDLLVGDTGHPYLGGLRDLVRILPVRAGRESTLSDYLPSRRPDALLTGKLADDFAALIATEREAAATRVIACVGTLMSARLQAYRFRPVRAWRERRRIADAYRRLDGIAAVSEGVAEDLRRHFGVSGVPISVLNNPVIPDDLDRLVAAGCPHPWFAHGEPPVITAVGGLRKVKDFATLLRAFAGIAPDSDARLLIIGEGKERPRLERLADRLGIGDRVGLPGFFENPFPCLARARLLALSSRREGLPNVLVEAMALGVPVVATDCTSGVRELLRNGRLGPLVPVGDVAALGRALARSLAAPPDRPALMAAAASWRQAPAARAWLDFIERIVGCRRAGS